MRKPLTVLLSFMLAASLIPAPALAEAAKETGAALEAEGAREKAIASVPIAAEHLVYDGKEQVGVGEAPTADGDVPSDVSAAAMAPEDGTALATQADGDMIASGTWGSCQWEIDSKGKLTVHPGTGASQANRTSSPWSDYSWDIDSVEFVQSGDEKVVLPADSSYLFNELFNVFSINLLGCDVSDVTDMSSMFSGCSSLCFLDLPGRSTLGSLDRSGWDTSSVTDMSSMFYSCTQLRYLDLSSWDTSSVTDMSSMFFDCSHSQLQLLGLSRWNTSSVTNMSSMFHGYSSLTSLDLSDWDTSSVTNMGGMFSSCSSLTSLDLSDWNTSSVTDMGSMFSGSSSLTSLNLSGWNTSSVTKLNSMFSRCSKLSSLDLSSWDTSKVTDMSRMFEACSELTSLNLSSWNTSSVTDMRYMFYLCPLLSSVGDLSGWNTSKVTNMICMFSGCSSLKSLDLSDWDTSMIGTMLGMFYGCSSLSSVGNLSDWDTSKVVVVQNMFSGCSSLTSLDLSGWNTSNLVLVQNMFEGCSSLTSLDLSGWDTSKVASAAAAKDMFSGCSPSTIKVGAGYAMKSADMFPKRKTGYRWHSAKDDGFYTSEEVVAQRSRKEDTYTLEEYTIDISGATFSVIDAKTYTGAPIMPEFTVHDGAILLQKDVDYTVSYHSNVNVGTATITIAGIGDYSGTATTTFSISPEAIATTDVSGVAESATFTGSPITMPVEVVVNGTTLQPPDVSDPTKGDYTVAYANNTNAGSAVVTVEGKNNYFGTAVKGFIINPVAIDSDAVALTGVEDKEFTGSAIEQDGLTLTLGDYTLAKGTDYTVAYSDNTNTGEATATITAKSKDDGGSGNFTGTRTAKFSITSKVLSDENAAVGAIEPVTYDGTAKTPEPTVTLKEGNRVLQKGTDYDLSYGNNTNVGTATVTITGKGNLDGSLTREFTINPAAITSVEDIADQTYTAEPITPALKVKAGEITLGAKDYSATFSNNTDAGTATVTVVGNANFTGVQTKSFVIAPATIDSVNVKGYHTYTGSAIEPELEVKAGSLKLGPNDYVATFSNNTNAGLGSASVTVTAVQGGNFSGSKQATFTIAQREIGNATIDAFPEQVYTGEPLTPELTLFDNGRTLAKGTDYEVTYADNTNVTAAGQFASITIAGKGNYTGTKPSGFSIAPRSIARATVTAGAQTFTGGALTPGVTVKLGDKTLDASDYDVVYADNVNAGTATVTVSGKGNYADTAKGTFQIRPASIADAEFQPINNQSFTGKAIKPEVSVSLGGAVLDPANYTVSYANNVKAGEATVTVTGTGNYTDSVSSAFRIDRVLIDSNDVIVSGIVDKTANGSEQTQDALTLRFGDYTLTSDDYTVEYANNTDAGEATITIKATEGGGFTGERTEHFRITQLTMGEVAAAAYTGEAITPKPAIKNGDTELVEGTDFDYEYANNTNAGVATVTVRGKGTYDGTTMSAQFTISPAAITEVTVAGDATYDGTAKTPEPTVKAGEKALTKGGDYTVEYRNNVNAGTASVVVTGKGNYGGARGVTFSIAGAGIAGATIDPIAEQTYTGKDIKPAVVVKLADKTLVEGEDYTVAYANNMDAGTATVTVTGAGNYTGEKTADFAITQKDLSGAQISAISDQTYTGAAIEPAFTVVLDGRTLTKDTDYTVAYENNVNAGDQAEVTVTGAGNYVGSVSRQFTIKARNLADATIDGLASFDADGSAKFVYTGDYVVPTVTVSLDGSTLVENSDYRLTYQNNLSAGQATATISAIGANPNYVGELTASFTIAPATITEVALKGNAEYAYTGEAKEPELVVRAGERTLNDGDYTVTYLNNVNAGGATATVTGKRNYAGKASVTFSIVDVNAEGLFIDAIPDQPYAGGDEIKPSLTVKFDGEVVDAQSYDVTYANNTGVGIATATITPKAGGNFSGARTVMFNIMPATIDSVSGMGSEVEYTGEPIALGDLTVKAGDRTLGADDYTVSYANNVNVGTAKLTVAGKGNYAGSRSFDFQITPKSLANYTVELPKNADGTDIIYAETAGLDAFEPVPVVKDTSGKVLDPANYDVAYLNNSVAGEASVVVTGRGNYQGSPADATFTIYKFAGTAAFDGENAVIWHVDGDGAMTIEPRRKDEDATLGSASSLTWSQAVADYTTSVSVDGNVTGCTDTSGMFSGLANLTSVDISEFDTSGVTNMSGMFEGCKSLTADGITGTLNTSGVTDMSNMFAGCTSLESLDFVRPVQQQNLFQSVGRLLLGTRANEGFDTSRVTDMSGMFQGCASLTGEGLKERLNTANVTDMSNMFAGCTGLTDLDLSGIDTTKVTDMSGMFAGCTGLTDLDLDGIDTTKVEDMSGMFKGCTGLKALNVASFNTGAVTNMAGMYDGCSLGQFTIGEGYMKANITEALPVPSASTGMWWATEAQVWRSNDTIRSLGTQASGTYISTGLLSANSTSIASANIDAATDNPYVYNGGEHKPLVDGVTIGQGQDQVPLVAGIDYEVGYQANQNAGTAQVVVTGMGDYSSSASRNFTIQPKSLEDNTIEVTAPADATYNGQEQKGKPAVRSTDGPEATLVEGTDYELGYQDNVNAGTATVTVTGKGNYGSTKTTTFKIGKAASSVSLEDQTLAYTGKALAYSGKVTKSGSAGGVTYAYFSDATCSKAVAASDVKAAGTYYVRGTLAADANHEEATSNVAKLTVSARTFPDVNAGAWYADVVARATGLGLLGGYDDGRFGPDDNITRGQVAVVLWKMANQPAGARDFPDVHSDDYFYQAVRWAGSVGVVNGYANGNFGPNDKATREQLATMLANYARNVAHRQATGSEADYDSMTDKGNVSGWAAPSVGWCFQNGILNGSNGQLRPQGNASRAEACKMVVGLYDLL